MLPEGFLRAMDVLNLNYQDDTDAVGRRALMVSAAVLQHDSKTVAPVNARVIEALIASRDEVRQAGQ